MAAEFTCPVSLASFQYYLKDASTDATYKAFLQSLLDAATSRVYYYLRRDYTASASKIDWFWGNNDRQHQLRWFPATAFTAIHEISSVDGSDKTLVLTDFIFSPYNCLYRKPEPFWASRMYKITYTLASNNFCPDMVMQVITEMAYRSFEESTRGLGALGKGTDFSNVLGQSSLRYVDLTPIEQQKLMPFVWWGGS